MKFIHAADIHLGSRMDSSLPKDRAEERRRELRLTFERMLDFAVGNGVRAVLLSGDVFDSDHPFKKDREFFYGTVRSHPEVDVLYLKGNHDKGTDKPDDIPNLLTFSETWTRYTYDNTDIYGIELTDENRLTYAETFRADGARVNIVMLHGQIGSGNAGETIDLPAFSGRGVDYFALGHIHKRGEYAVDRRGTAVYAGCLEGRGYDEPGAHGFEVVTVEDGKVSHEFVPFAARTVDEITVDTTGCADWLAVRDLVRETVSSHAKDNLWRIYLVGTVAFDGEALTRETEKLCEPLCFAVSVKNKTAVALDMAALEGELSLRGEFFRVLGEKNDIPEEDRQKILAYGLKALAGEEIEG